VIAPPIFFAAAIIIIVAAGFVARGYKPVTNEYRELSKHDQNLIETAKSLDGLSVEQQYYVWLIGRRLLSLNTGRINSIITNQFLSFLTMAATFLAVGITGTDYVECNEAKSVSFAINLIAAALTAINQLFSFEKTALHCEKMAGYFRWELEQFVGASREYCGLSIQARYDTFTLHTDQLIEKDIKGRREGANGVAPSKKEQIEKTDKAIDEQSH
jgi:hypothetical protein